MVINKSGYCPIIRLETKCFDMYSLSEIEKNRNTLKNEFQKK